MTAVDNGVLHFLVAAGDLSVLERMYPAIEAWGKSKGCTKASCIGRRGWARTFLTKEQGWKETHVVMTKELTCQGH